MLIGGKKANAPRPVETIIYREDSEGKPDNLVFVCGAVLDYTPFDRICPVPKPPLVSPVGKPSYLDDQDKGFQSRLESFNTLRFQYLILTSLSATPGLQWETVDINQPDTWKNYESELKSFLTDQEAARLINAVLEANMPSQNRRREALNVFTNTEGVEANSTTSQTGEATNTQSSGPAKG